MGTPRKLALTIQS